MQNTRERTLRLRGRPEASASIWNWQAEQVDARTEQTEPGVRLRGGLQALAGAAFGVLAFLFWSRTVGSVALGLAALILFSSLISPGGLYASIQRIFEATGRAVGRVLTWVLMVPIFYLFFLPFGLLLRRGRRDRLRRYFEPEASSYWEPHDSVTAASRERQY